MKNTADVIIVGAGIVGNATAYYLAKSGSSVIVLEGDKNIGNGASSRNGGGVRQSGRDARELPLMQFGVKISGPRFPMNWAMTVNTIRMGTCVWERRKNTCRS